jgi:hypothetical protein
MTGLVFAVSAGCAAQAPTPQQRLAKIGSALAVGTQEDVAVRLLRGQGFHCRELARSGWTDADPSVVRTLFCPASTEPAPGGFSVTYVNLGIDASHRLATISSGSYGSGTVPAERR